jgi:hypothetical protein
MSKNLVKIADAVDPLYSTLDQRQRGLVMQFVRSDWQALYPNSDRRGRRR